MRFNSETSAWEYWYEAYSISGGDLDKPFEDQAELFNSWVDKNNVKWLDQEDQEFINSWNNNL